MYLLNTLRIKTLGRRFSQEERTNVWTDMSQRKPMLKDMYRYRKNRSLSLELQWFQMVTGSIGSQEYLNEGDIGYDKWISTITMIIEPGIGEAYLDLFKLCDSSGFYCVNCHVVNIPKGGGVSFVISYDYFING